VGGIFIGTAGGLTVIRRNDTWPRSLTLVYGTAPVISSLSVSPPIFNPAAAPGVIPGVAFSLTAATFQSRSVTVQAAFRNLVSGSVLRMLTSPAHAAGSIQFTWDGRADNGAWVAPGLYEATLTITDSAGSSTVVKPLVMVRYE
jgi:hypothetical protein